ncbi:hypothetical protein O181_111179 [Austropuccinia psidii MF-1]|uniref:Retrotransposon gag domain-containing protein n=1 Tax=Austropuccinia psidii MF-1 TaxID=1389203 RepID=A0A9Q3K1H2_9BASI|nr:hypothetical protein [Austropuccinia psidii MF-1]
MPIKHSPSVRQTRSQARTKAVLTPTPRAPLDCTPAIPQLRAHLDRVPNLEVPASSRKEGRVPRRSSSFSGVVGRFPGLPRTALTGPGDDVEEEEGHSVEEEDSDGTEGFPAPVGHSKNDPENFSQDRKKALYTTSLLIGRAAKWIEPYLSNLTNKDSNHLLNSWKLFESQLYNLFRDPNEVRKAEADLDSLRMKEGGHVSLYIANFRSLASRIGDWGERALIHHFRKGLPSSILDQLASHPSIIDSLQYLMDVTLELDTRYHERKKEKSNHKKKKPETLKSNSSHHQNSSISSQKKKKNFHPQKRNKPHLSLPNKDFKFWALKNKEESRRAYVPIVMGSIVLIPVSKGLKTSLPNHQENFSDREKPE